MEKLISVVMSTFNEDPLWIEESVGSILKQTYKNFEFIIMVDNPENIELIKHLNTYAESDDRIKVIINPKNLGLVETLNRAFKICKGEYFARMDSDDIAINTRLENQLEYLERNNYDFIFSGVNIINEEGKYQYSTDDVELNSKQTANLFRYGNISKHPTWFFKKKIFEKLGGYRQISYCEDYDFILRAVKEGFRVSKIKGLYLNYRIRENSISRSNLLKQFLYSLEIKSAFNIGKLDDLVYLSNRFKIIDQKVTKLLDDNYAKSQVLFNTGIKQIKQKKFSDGIFQIIKSIQCSNYSLFKLVDLIKFRIHRKRILLTK